MTITEELFSDLRFLGLLAAIIAFLVSTRFYLYPNIISISKTKGLMDVPGERKIHTTQIPTLGGLGVFITFSLCIIGFGLLTDLVKPDLVKLLALLGSTIILLFLGIKDDLISISPKKKFVGQLLAVVNVVVLTDVRILSFEGLLGVGELPYLISILFTVFVFVLVINALNLIDGIDGLAGSIAVISSISFGILFLLNGDYMMTLISSVLVGSLVGFLRYNLSNRQKIFMGDCGSMLTGFLLSYQGISFLAMNTTNETSNTVSNAPIVLLAILSYPLFDLLRVFAIRIKQKRSPFSADSNHIHHRLLRLGLNHKKATLLLCICNAFVIGFTFLLTDLSIHLQLLITVFSGASLYLLPFLKVFEIDINLAFSKNDVEPIRGSIPKLKTNDPFELDFKPITILAKNKEGEKVKGITLPVDYIMNMEVVLDTEDALLPNMENIETKTQRTEVGHKKRTLARRAPEMENMVE
jgi:UDP-N-acetylmuramyl pentapeptide phosphotransferase/UDP-N-acetylglucosamine-1-phosphate transferase